jgi:hypothetical protein
MLTIVSINHTKCSIEMDLFWLRLANQIDLLEEKDKFILGKICRLCGLNITKRQYWYCRTLSGSILNKVNHDIINVNEERKTKSQC